MCEFLGIAREFASEYSKQLIENRLGKDKLVPLFNYPAQRRFAPTAGKHQSRDYDVRVENDLHSRR